MSMTGLYVEDDLELSKVVIENLTDRGLKVKWVRSVKEALELLKGERFKFYILDISLTDGLGYEVADYIKSEQLSGPVIFLTARSNANDRLKGYEYGACEYIPKPFLFEELWLRLDHALEEHGDPETLKLSDDVSFNVSEMVVYGLNENGVILTKKESLFLKKIFEKKPKPFERSEILDVVWSKDSFPTERTVDNLVVKLRQKLMHLGANIKSVRGVGYKWSSDDES